MMIRLTVFLIPNPEELCILTFHGLLCRHFPSAFACASLLFARSVLRPGFYRPKPSIEASRRLQRWPGRRGQAGATASAAATVPTTGQKYPAAASCVESLRSAAERREGPKGGTEVQANTSISNLLSLLCRIRKELVISLRP